MKRVRTFIAKRKGLSVELTVKISQAKSWVWDDLSQEIENSFDNYYKLLLQTFNQKEIRIKCR